MNYCHETGVNNVKGHDVQVCLKYINKAFQKNAQGVCSLLSHEIYEEFSNYQNTGVDILSKAAFFLYC